jgi:hypothetical protein
MEDLDLYFKSDNSNYLWNKIKVKLERFTTSDLTKIVDKYMSLKYSTRTNPIEFKNQFDGIVRELELAGVNLPDRLHLAIWFKAISPELDALKQALNANANIKWEDVHEALVSQYSNKKIIPSERKDEKAQAVFDQRKKNIKFKRDQPKFNKDNDLDRTKGKYTGKQHCEYCEKDYHTINNCLAYKRDQEAAARLNKSKSHNSDSELDDPYAAVFIEDELATTLKPDLADAFNFQDEEELVVAGIESSNPVHFLFDSAATTHVTPNKQIINNLDSAPSVTMSTALNGQRSIINKRGTVRLNDKWTLLDVAYVPQASTSLISEGRLCDAGYGVYKNKDFVHVRDKNDKVVLRGVRANRLWVFTVNGNVPTGRPLNTIIPTKATPAPNNNIDNNVKYTKPSAIQTQRVIPKKAQTGGATNGKGKNANISTDNNASVDRSS